MRSCNVKTQICVTRPQCVNNAVESLITSLRPVTKNTPLTSVVPSPQANPLIFGKSAYNACSLWQQFRLHRGSTYYIATASKAQRSTYRAGPRASPSSQIIVFALTEHHPPHTANSTVFPVTQTRKTIYKVQLCVKNKSVYDN